tara:strand:+ start:985 stop:1848 length:864 start_codon:yes stop_codon:yes gene_type:complete
MKFLFFSFIINAIRLNNIKTIITSNFLTKESFVGSWFINENNKKSVIHLKSQGSIYKSSIKKSNYIGYWNVNKDFFYFNLRDNNIEKKYYGKIFNNSLNISGNVCEGLISPYFVNNFTMIPVFQQFHNISFINKTDTYTYINQNNVTGKWLLENLYTNKLYLLELHLNNTWNTINLNYTNNKLSGKWNLFNETNEINTNYAIKFNGKNIWLNINKQKNQSYVTYDIIFLGKIVQLGNIFYFDENKPSSYNEDKIIISSKINGSVVYGFDMEPEISESFYMKRWYDSF